MDLMIGLALVLLALAGFCLADEPPRTAQVEGLPDFSWAGYHGGREPPPAPRATLNVRDFGGVGDGKADDTKALQAALAKAHESGGVVAVPEGRWVLTDVLAIHRDGVVLQGAGSARTVLVCPKSLSDMFGYRPGWSWGGGMIQVQPAKGAARPVARVVAEAKAGGDRLQVEWLDGRKGRPGEWLELLWYNDTGADTLLDHLYGGVIARGRMGSELQAATGPRVREWVRLERVEGDAVTIQQPLRIDARPAWRPTLVAAPLIREVGVEGLAIEFPLTPYPGHLKERGYNGIDVEAAADCWVRDVRTVNADSGVFVNRSRYVTVCGVRIEGRQMHHCLAASWSADCLFTDWRIDAPHVHGTTISWCAHGNVFARGRGRALAMDSHRAASFANLHTDILIEQPDARPQPFRSGGSGPRGPHAAARNVYWNIRYQFPQGGEKPVAIRGHDEWPLGIFVGWSANRPLQFEPAAGMGQRILSLNAVPQIQDLHEAQAAGRRGAPP